MNACPYCHRHLLSLASRCCNWCGREIPDAAYQQRAEVRREAFFLEQALHDAASLAQMEALNVNSLAMPVSPLMALPAGSALPMRRGPCVEPQAPPPEAPAAEESPGGRFQHLEL